MQIVLREWDACVPDCRKLGGGFFPNWFTILKVSIKNEKATFISSVKCNLQVYSNF